MSRGLTWLSYDGLRLRRRLILANLERAYPDVNLTERTRLGRECVYHTILTAFEVLRSQRIDIARDITILGRERVERALSEGRGCYILCGHLGNWEAFSAKVSRTVAPAHVVVKPFKNPGFDRYVNERRDQNGFRRIVRQGKGDAVKAVFKALRRGEIVGMVVDQSRPGEPLLPFFGHPAKTNTALATFLNRHPAPVIPGYIRRLALGRHEIVLEDPIELASSGDRDRDILEHSQLVNNAMEMMIKSNPEQYFWMHNRWKA